MSKHIDGYVQVSFNAPDENDTAPDAYAFPVTEQPTEQADGYKYRLADMAEHTVYAIGRPDFLESVSSSNTGIPSELRGRLDRAGVLRTGQLNDTLVTVENLTTTGSLNIVETV